MAKKDSLGDRMKEFYENRTRNLLPRRTYTIIRVDGKAFHTYTRGLERPFDMQLIADMDATACYMCKNIQGAKLAFVQSDEISIVLTDFDKLGTAAWFDGNIQKMASVSASLATAKFNQLRPDKIALFDSRVFTIPSAIEVENYLIWRQQDTTRNSISSVAQYLYSPKELHGKDTDTMQEMCFQKGVNWNDYEAKLKRGRLIVKETYDKEGATRTRWVSIAPPIFTQERELLADLIPNNFEKVEARGAFSN
jgi:tRNA(His) guanylyltransferase